MHAQLNRKSVKQLDSPFSDAFNMDNPNSLTTTPTKREIENARTKGQIVGWAQGAGAVLVFGLVLNFLGWSPLATSVS